MAAQQTFLVLHFVGLVLVSGATVGAWIVDTALWRRLPADRPGAAALAGLLQPVGRSAQLGAVVLLASGVAILWSVHWAFWGATWLTVKLGLFVALGVIGGAFGGRAGRQLRAALTADGPVDEALLASLRSKRNLFRLVETLLFAVVIALAVFKG